MKVSHEINNSKLIMECCYPEHNSKISLEIKPNQEYIACTLHSIFGSPYSVRYCLNCSDRIFDEIRSVLDPTLRFYK